MARTAEERGIQPPTMTGAEMRDIREEAGLSIYELAALMYYQDTKTLRRMESRDERVSGPMQLILELVRDKKVDVDAELR